MKIERGVRINRSAVTGINRIARRLRRTTESYSRCVVMIDSAGEDEALNSTAFLTGGSGLDNPLSPVADAVLKIVNLINADLGHDVSHERYTNDYERGPLTRVANGNKGCFIEIVWMPGRKRIISNMGITGTGGKKDTDTLAKVSRVISGVLNGIEQSLDQWSHGHTPKALIGRKTKNPLKPLADAAVTRISNIAIFYATEVRSRAAL